MEAEQRKTTPGWRSFLEATLHIAVVFFVVAILAFVLSAVESILTPRAAAAASLKGYEALPVSMTGRGEINMKPGETKTVVVGFQNIGTTSWTQDGSAFVSIYTHEPKYRTSVFQDASWEKADQPSRLTERSVAPKEVGHLSFILKAPRTGGTYAETFSLAAEDTAWIPGGKFTLKIRVEGEAVSTRSEATSPLSTPSDSDDTEDTSDGYAATILIKSAKTLRVDPKQTVSYTVGLKNLGTKTWKTRSLRLPTVAMATSTPDYSHRSWSDDEVAVVKEDGEVAPGALDLITFQFTAPSKRGSYTAQFVLVADNVEVSGSEIDIPIEVTGDAPDVKDRSKRKEAKKAESRSLMDEPTMRVGVLIVDEETDDRVDITCASDVELQDEDGEVLAKLDDGDEVEAWYRGGRYSFEVDGEEEKTSSYLRFVPEKKNAICTVTNFDRRKTRGAAYADNTFRNILELRHNSTKDRTWLINELPMEMYLRGLAETSNVSHINFQRALITAARTYGLYHWERATKHASEYFHVDAYADQVYKGYGQEQRTPKLTQAVEDTRGQVVTHKGKTAITPYFSRSDGRTRSWSEVWYGDVAWLKSVSAPCDKGKTLWGHGVGMSASQALCMANDGEDWEEILTYFYTGVDIKQRWK